MRVINILYCSEYNYVVETIQDGQKALREKGVTSFLFRYWGKEGIESEKGDDVVPDQFDIIVLDADALKDHFNSLIENLSKLRKEKTLFLTIYGTQYLHDLGFKDLGCYYEHITDEIFSFAA